jgi:hypothetical protein
MFGIHVQLDANVNVHINGPPARHPPRTLIVVFHRKGVLPVAVGSVKVTDMAPDEAFSIQGLDERGNPAAMSSLVTVDATGDNATLGTVGPLAKDADGVWRGDVVLSGELGILTITVTGTNADGTTAGGTGTIEIDAGEPRTLQVAFAGGPPA